MDAVGIVRPIGIGASLSNSRIRTDVDKAVDPPMIGAEKTIELLALLFKCCRGLIGSDRAGKHRQHDHLPSLGATIGGIFLVAGKCPLGGSTFCYCVRPFPHDHHIPFPLGREKWVDLRGSSIDKTPRHGRIETLVEGGYWCC